MTKCQELVTVQIPAGLVCAVQIVIAHVCLESVYV